MTARSSSGICKSLVSSQISPDRVVLSFNMAFPACLAFLALQSAAAGAFIVQPVWFHPSPVIAPERPETGCKRCLALTLSIRA